VLQRRRGGTKNISGNFSFFIFHLFAPLFFFKILKNMSTRLEKVNDLIRDNLSLIIKKDLSLKKGVFVSITKVDTSKDLRYTKVFVSIFPEKEIDYTLATLQKELFHIQKLLNGKLSVKIFPRIKFILDNTGKKISELDEIFEQIKNEK
jgi:ribosome-binding factor A